LARTDAIRGKISSHLQIARQRQQVFAGLSSVSSAPSLRTINGCGFMLYGSTDPDPGTNSYMATYYFVVFFCPIFPISRYRVISSGNGYRFLAKGPLRVFDKIHLAVSLLLMAFIIFV
jgi:hypothetical protein